MIKVLHIIPSFAHGGAARALLGMAKYSTRGSKFTHQVVSLRPAAPFMVAAARRDGIEVLETADATALRAVLETTDITLAHFWNTPELYEWLRSEIPPTRLALWLHVAGAHAPQIIARALIDYADCAVATSTNTTALFQNIANARVITSGADWERLAGMQPVPHDTFNIGYIGTVDFAKMHAQYVSMNARANIPNVQFIVAGSGDAFTTLQRQAHTLGVAERFQWRGYVEDVRGILQTLDVFGYPLCPENYSTSELVLQEAMYAGIPAVVLPYGGAARVVQHNVTGLVAQNETEYAHALEFLYEHPDERARLGNAARAHAQKFFGAEKTAQQWNDVFETMLQEPKRARQWKSNRAKNFSGAEFFIEALGDAAHAFRTSMFSTNANELLEAETRIAAAPPMLSHGDGGILSYRYAYPNDGYLRYWSGLVLQAQERRALAAAEFIAARALGVPAPRVEKYLAQIFDKP